MRECLALLVSLFITITGLADTRLTEAFVTAHGQRLDQLFQELDPEHVKVGPLVEQWNTGARIEALNGLASYYRQKQFSAAVLEPLSFGHNLEQQATGILDDTFVVHDQKLAVPSPGGFLDWELASLEVDKELAWMLNRHWFLPQLAEAGRQLEDPRFRAKLNGLWQDWILNNPYPDKLSFSPQWRALEVARRILNSWTHVFHDNASIEDETLLLALSSIPDHADALHEHGSFWGGNHLITEQLALLTIASAWPEFSDSSIWRASATASLTGQIMKQTYPDGSYKELSNHYQKVVLRSSHQFMKLLAAEDPDYREFPVAKRIEKLWEFFAYSTRPDGFGPLNNASDLENNAALLKDVWEFYNRPDWLAIATNAAMGNLGTASLSRLFPWAGQVIMRNEPGPDADWLYFDAGPYGTAHQHVDRLHLSASINGRPILVDSGRYTYEPGPWRDYFKGPESHSLLMLDGKASEQGPRQADHPMEVVFEEREEVVFAAATTRFVTGPERLGLPSLKAPVPWTRAILFDKRGIAIVLDHVVTFRQHDYKLVWNLHPDVSRGEIPELVQLVAGPAGSRTEITEGMEDPAGGGWYSPEYGIKNIAHQLKTTGSIHSPTTFITILKNGMDDGYSIKLVDKQGTPVIRFRILRGDEHLAEAEVRLHPKPELVGFEKILLTETGR